MSNPNHWTERRFRDCTWIECGQKLLLYFILWGVIGPAMLIGGLMLIGMMVDGISQYNVERDRCLKQATNGYEIKQCR